MKLRSAVAVVLLVAALFPTGACSGGGGGNGGAADVIPAEAEPNDLPGEATALAAGSPLRVRGRLASADDRDLFRFVAAARGRIAAVLTVPAGADQDLALLAADGRRLATARADNRDPKVGPEERLFAPLPAAGDFLLEVSGAAGHYELAIETTPAPAPAAARGETGPTAWPRCFHAVALLPDGGAIVGGGTREAGSKEAAMLTSYASTEIFDPATGAFREGPDLGSSRFGPTATALADGRVLFAGGDIGGTAVLYDPARNAVVARSIPLAGTNRFLHTATLLPDGRVLLAGGYRLVLELPPRAEALATTEVFDPKTVSFAAGPALLHRRDSHAATLLRDGRVLIAGGVNRRDTEIVDLAADPPASVAGPEMASVRDDHTATTLSDGRVLVTGGQGGGGRSLDTAEILDDPTAAPGSAFRALAARLTAPRSDHLAVLLPDGGVLLLGGETDPGDNRDAVLASVDRFDPASEEISGAPPLRVPRDDARAVLLPDGRVLVTGGEDEAADSIREAELY